MRWLIDHADAFVLVSIAIVVFAVWRSGRRADPDRPARRAGSEPWKQAYYNPKQFRRRK